MNQRPRSIKLIHQPTPIEKMERLSDTLGGPEIYMKRDDFTGSEISGNKVRKLEFSIAEALDQGADMLITCGGMQSNHARATAVAAAKLGISSCLILSGTGKEQLNGNYFLDVLVGAKIKIVSPEQFHNEIEAIFARTKEEMEQQGYKPYIIPLGASNGIGTFGYVKAMEEISRQEKELGINFNKIVVAVGSGGTYAGLLLGSRLNGQEKEIYGINVSQDADYFTNRIEEILREAQDYLEDKVNIKRSDIHILDGYVGPGYALNNSEQIESIKKVAQLEGIILDPVYTGKAMHGLIEEIKKGRVFSKEDKILFIHTGGQYGLFPTADRF